MAVAVLSIWMLCLLSPLHQTAGILRDMAKVGIDISQAWSICVTIANTEDGAGPPAANCPLHAVAKTGSPDTTAILVFGVIGVLVGVIYQASDLNILKEKQRYSASRPRAPPRQS